MLNMKLNRLFVILCFLLNSRFLKKYKQYFGHAALSMLIYLLFATSSIFKVLLICLDIMLQGVFGDLIDR